MAESLVYVDILLVGTETRKTCAVCGKPILWPDGMRVYASAPGAEITRVEHLDHRALEGARQVRRGT